MNTKTNVLFYLSFIISAFYLYAQRTSNTIDYWEEYTVKRSQKSAGFVDTKDLNGDGFQEIALSTLQEQGGGFSTPIGALRVFENNTQSIESTWQEDLVISTNERLGFINSPVFMDINQDGNEDILIHQGFLTTNSGSYFWLKGPDFSERFYVSEETKSSEYFWHETVQIDLDGDGLLDLISTSANTNVTPPVKRIEWYQNIGNDSFKQHIIVDGFGGVFIKSYDIDKDQDQDIVVSQFFGPPFEDSLVWLEQKEKPSVSNNWTGVWEPHTIDNTTGLGYHIEFYDIDADGKDELVYNNHNNQNNDLLVDSNGKSIEAGIYWFEIPQEPMNATSWEKITIDEGYEVNTFDFGNPQSQGALGIYSIGDLNNDGLPDIIMPGDGTKNLFYLEQSTDHSFRRSTIAKGTMFGMAKITDIDGDGSNEVLAAMHNFPDNFFQAIFRFPNGNLKIYQPILAENNATDEPYQDVNIFPNPTKENITIQFDSKNANDKETNIYIIDANNVIQYQGILNKQMTFDVSDWHTGFYYIKLKSLKNSVVKSFFKE